MGQPRVQRFRQVLLHTVNMDPPFDNPSTDPQFTLTPKGSDGLPTMACTFMYNLPPGTQAVPPFVVTPWVRDPITGLWASCRSSAPLMDRQLFNVEVDSAEIFFHFGDNGANGDVVAMVSER